MENKRNQTYKTKGLEFYITNALNKNHAVKSFIQYRIGVTENDIELFEGKIPKKAHVMPAIELKTRELALVWWNNQGQGRRNWLTNNYLGNQRFEYSLTSREIEEIFKKETAHIDPTDIQSAYMMQVKANQKQFKEFNPELFKAYIDKFSDEDKIKAILILGNSIPTNMISQHLVEDVFPEIGLR